MDNKGIAARDNLGRIVHREGPTPGAGRPSLDASEKLRAAIQDLVQDDEVMAAWSESMKRKLRKGNTFATAFVRDTLLGKPAVTVVSDTGGALTDFMQAWRKATSDQDQQP